MSTPSEHDEQVAFIQWLELTGYMFSAIPNGGVRHIGQAMKLKAEGVRPGVPDVLVIVNRMLVWIEMKRKDLKPKRGGSGGVSLDQKKWIKALNECSNCEVFVCYGAVEAIEKIRSLASLPKL